MNESECQSVVNKWAGLYGYSDAPNNLAFCWSVTDQHKVRPILELDYGYGAGGLPLLLHSASLLHFWTTLTMIVPFSIFGVDSVEYVKDDERAGETLPNTIH